MRKRGAFYNSKPYIFIDSKVYVGEENEYHIDLAQRTGHVLSDWLTNETYNGRVWEKEGKFDRLSFNDANLTETTKRKIESALRHFYGEAEAPLGRTFSGAVSTATEPVSGIALRADQFRNGEEGKREAAWIMEQPYVVVAEIGDVDYEWCTGNETTNIPNCVGMISAKGGINSHFALVAREQDKPYIIAPGAMKIRHGDQVDIYSRADDKPGFPAGTIDVNGGGSAQVTKDIGHPTHSFAYSNGSYIANEDLDHEKKIDYLRQFDLWNHDTGTSGHLHKGGYIHHYNEKLEDEEFHSWAKNDFGKGEVHTVSTDEPIYAKTVLEEKMRFIYNRFNEELLTRNVDLEHPANPATLHDNIKDEIFNKYPDRYSFMNPGAMMNVFADLVMGVGYTNNTAEAYTGEDKTKIKDLSDKLRNLGYTKTTYGGTYGGVGKQSSDDSVHKCPKCGSHTTKLIDAENKLFKCHKCKKEFKDKNLVKNPKVAVSQAECERCHTIQPLSMLRPGVFGGYICKVTDACMDRKYQNGTGTYLDDPGMARAHLRGIHGSTIDDHFDFFLAGDQDFPPPGTDEESIVCPRCMGSGAAPEEWKHDFCDMCGGYGRIPKWKAQEIASGKTAGVYDTCHNCGSDSIQSFNGLCASCGYDNNVFGDRNPGLEMPNDGWDDWPSMTMSAGDKTALRHVELKDEYKGVTEIDTSTCPICGADSHKRSDNQRECTKGHIFADHSNEHVVKRGTPLDDAMMEDYFTHRGPSGFDHFDNGQAAKGPPDYIRDKTISVGDRVEVIDEPDWPYLNREQGIVTKVHGSGDEWIEVKLDNPVAGGLGDDPNDDYVTNMHPNELKKIGADYLTGDPEDDGLEQAFRMEPSHRCKLCGTEMEEDDEGIVDWVCPDCGHIEDESWRQTIQNDDVGDWENEGGSHLAAAPHVRREWPLLRGRGTGVNGDMSGYYDPSGEILFDSPGDTPWAQGDPAQSPYRLEPSGGHCSTCGGLAYKDERGGGRQFCPNCNVSGKALRQEYKDPEERVKRIPHLKDDINYKIHPDRFRDASVKEAVDATDIVTGVALAGLIVSWVQRQIHEKKWNDFHVKWKERAFQRFQREGYHPEDIAEAFDIIDQQRLLGRNLSLDLSGPKNERMNELLEDKVKISKEADATKEKHWTDPENAIPFEQLVAANQYGHTRYGFVMTKDKPKGYMYGHAGDHLPNMNAFLRDLGGDWGALFNSPQSWGVISWNIPGQEASISCHSDVGKIDPESKAPMKRYVAKVTGIPVANISVGDNTKTNVVDYGSSTCHKLTLDEGNKPDLFLTPEQSNRSELKTSRVAKVADTNGHDLQAGRTYTMHSTKYKVPDVVMLTSVESDKLEAVISGDNKGYFPITITREDFDKFKYSFEPKMAATDKDFNDDYDMFSEYVCPHCGGSVTRNNDTIDVMGECARCGRPYDMYEMSDLERTSKEAAYSQRFVVRYDPYTKGYDVFDNEQGFILQPDCNYEDKQEAIDRARELEQQFNKRAAVNGECPHCGLPVSSLDLICPYCGRPTDDHSKTAGTDPQYVDKIDNPNMPYRWAYHPSKGLFVWPSHTGWHDDWAEQNGFTTPDQYAGGQIGEMTPGEVTEYHAAFSNPDLAEEGKRKIEEWLQQHKTAASDDSDPQLTCPQCHMNINWSASQGQVACRHCGWKGSPFELEEKRAAVEPIACPSCGHPNLISDDVGLLMCPECKWDEESDDDMTNKPSFSQLNHDTFPGTTRASDVDSELQDMSGGIYQTGGVADTNAIVTCPKCGYELDVVDTNSPSICPECKWPLDEQEIEPKKGAKEGTRMTCPECGSHNIVPDDRAWETSIWQCMNCGKQDYAELFDKTSAKKKTLSAQEQLELINEEGTARNLHKLNLEGTHYDPIEEHDELTAHFNWFD